MHYLPKLDCMKLLIILIAYILFPKINYYQDDRKNEKFLHSVAEIVGDLGSLKIWRDRVAQALSPLPSGCDIF